MEIAPRFLLGVLAAITGLAQQEVSPTEKESALGKHLAQEIRRDSQVLDVAEAKRYVENLVRQLEASLPLRPGMLYTVELLADSGKGLNEPLILPGAHLFVRAGLFQTAGTEAEFAAILAHSMAHASANYSMRQSVNMAGIPLVWMGGWTGIHGSDLRFLVPASVGERVRNFEPEADRLAVTAMARAGFDPSALLWYAQQADSPDRQRSAALEEAIGVLPAQTYVVESSAYANVREQVAEKLSEAKPRPVPSLRRKVEL